MLARPLSAAAAPADEYFGVLRLSNLGIRNIIHDIGVEGDSPLALPAQEVRIREAHTALFAWADKYPRDTWLPSAMYGFGRMTQNKRQAWMDAHAIATLYFLRDRYADSSYAKSASALLASYEQSPPWDLNVVEALAPVSIDLTEFRRLRR